MNAFPLPRTAAAIAAILFAANGGARAAVRLPALFSDHMVLQSNLSAPVWGWADPGETVTVSIAEQTQATTAGADGKWSVRLQPLTFSSPLTLSVRASNTLTVHDVLAGEVWLCSGQSNMGYPVGRSLGGEEAAKAADFPQIRIFTLASAGTVEPRDEAPGKWEICSPAIASRFTAVGFYFARGLFQELKTPVGIIHSSVGGTPIENWISREALDAVPGYKERTDARLALMRSQAEDAKQFPAARDRWEEANGVKPPEISGAALGWADPGFDDHDWKTITLPAKWADSMGAKQGGVFWLRKEVTLSPEVAGKPFGLVLNYMHEQYDTTWFNGVEVGHTGGQPPYFYMGERRYEIPAKLVKAGRNVIAVRVVAANPRADLMGRGARGDYNLPADQKQVGNQWRGQLESLLPALSAEALKARPKVNTAAPFDTPVVLYNAMIHPLIPYGLRGFVWYQGESNTGHPDDYGRLFPLLIEDWRRRWAQGPLPFYYVQIANFGDRPKDPNQPSGWATVREAQAKTAQTVPNTGMAVIIDADDGENMHPHNKQPVGERLTRLALARTYGRAVEDTGPTFDKMQVEDNRLRIHFHHGEGLTSQGGPPKWFAIAGSDHQFAWAEARIDGESVVLSSPTVAHPVAARYGWADNPVGANLYNSAGLPAAPFRTDDAGAPTALVPAAATPSAPAPLITPAGRQWHVNPDTGDDQHDGLSAETSGASGPFKTIARAVKLSGPGDTIHLAKCTFHEQVMFAGVKSGEPGRPITVDGHDAVIDGAFPLDESQWEKVGPGLYRNATIFKSILQSKWEFVDRFSFVFDGKLVRMNHSVKAPRVPWKKPEELQAGEWTYQKEDDNAYYLKIDPARTLAGYRIALPTIVSGVQVDGNISHLVFRNITVTHVVNDGFALRTSPVGAKVRDILYQNIRTIEACDDGFSAHDDCEVRVENFLADGCSTGIATAGLSYNDRVVTRNIHGVDLLFGQGVHTVANSRLETHGATAAISVDTWSQKPGLDSCSLTLDNVVIVGPAGGNSAANRLQVRGPKSALSLRHASLHDISILAADGGSVALADSTVQGHHPFSIVLSASSPWVANRNVYGSGTFHIGSAAYSTQDFATYQKATGQDDSSHVAFERDNAGLDSPAPPNAAGADQSRIP